MVQFPERLSETLFTEKPAGMEQYLTTVLTETIAKKNTFVLIMTIAVVPIVVAVSSAFMFAKSMYEKTVLSWSRRLIPVMDAKNAEHVH